MARKLAFILSCLLVALVVYALIRRHLYERDLTDARSALASRDNTVEIQHGVYERLSVETKNLRQLLIGKDAQLSSLESEISKRREDILAVDQLVVKWKKPYETKGPGKQTDVASARPGDPQRKRVDFDHDFGYIGVIGYTLTDPPEALLSVRQNRPLKIGVSLTQSKDKRWHTYVTSSEENIGIDLAVSAVNPWILEPRWYERMSVNVFSGFSSSSALLGLGVGYRIGQFDIGPVAWMTGQDVLYGGSLSWRPFQR